MSNAISPKPAMMNSGHLLEYLAFNIFQYLTKLRGEQQSSWISQRICARQ
jgi:hypothetical protein